MRATLVLTSYHRADGQDRWHWSADLTNGKGEPACLQGWGEYKTKAAASVAGRAWLKRLWIKVENGR